MGAALVLVIASASVSRIVRDRSDLEQNGTNGRAHLGTPRTNLRADSREELGPLHAEKASFPRAEQVAADAGAAKKRSRDGFLPASRVPVPGAEKVPTQAPAQPADLDDTAIDAFEYPAPTMEEEDWEGQMEVEAGALALDAPAFPLPEAGEEEVEGLEAPSPAKLPDGDESLPSIARGRRG